MAKEWGVNQRTIMEIRRVRNSKIRGDFIHKKPEKGEPKPGIKSIVIKVYAEKGKLAAWQTLQEYNKKLSGDGFTLEMLEQWIGEYHAKQPNRGMEKDDGSYR